MTIPLLKPKEHCQRQTIKEKGTIGETDGIKEIQDYLQSIDFVPPSVPPMKGHGKLVVLEDNDAVIKMTIKCRAPSMFPVPKE